LLRKQQKTLGGYFFLPHPVQLREVGHSRLGDHRHRPVTVSVLDF